MCYMMFDDESCGVVQRCSTAVGISNGMRLLLVFNVVLVN